MFSYVLKDTVLNEFHLKEWGGDFSIDLQGAKCLFLASLLGEEAAKERRSKTQRDTQIKKKKNHRNKF